MGRATRRTPFYALLVGGYTEARSTCARRLTISGASSPRFSGALLLDDVAPRQRQGLHREWSVAKIRPLTRKSGWPMCEASIASVSASAMRRKSFSVMISPWITKRARRARRPAASAPDSPTALRAVSRELIRKNKHGKSASRACFSDQLTGQLAG